MLPKYVIWGYANVNYEYHQFTVVWYWKSVQSTSLLPRKINNMYKVIGTEA